ncbi:hypothetical protein [Paenibacillus sp. FSL E2-0190]|uniref:hypothetical protein n=1 Tax=Paenibacillus sp. FSL E2-0190 TaxID=2954504 RepID=UPI0030EF166D
MKEEVSTEQNIEEQWIEELLTLSKDEKLTPKQISILQAAIEVFSEKGYSLRLQRVKFLRRRAWPRERFFAITRLKMICCLP